jgi:transposase
MRFELSEQELSDFHSALEDDDLSARLRRKLIALRMRNTGIPVDMIASSLGTSVRSISNYISEYRAGGLAATMEDRSYRPESSVEPYLEELEKSFRKEPVGNAKQGRARIKQVTGITLSLSQTRRVMHRLGMRYRKTGQTPGKADSDKQLEFLDEELRPRLVEASEGKRKVFFVDAAHFVMGAVMGMLWCFTRMFVRGASGRHRYNVLGALDSETKEVVTVTNDSYITAPTVCELLEELRRRHPAIPITLVLDNARYQKCKLVTELAGKLDVELLYLPPYSPNLNIIERLWKYVKQSSLKNTYYESFAAFTDAIDSKIRDVNTTLRDELRSLFSLRFQVLDRSKNGIL